jgi:tetratricopeptide (TPR) repeat protein
MARLSNATLLFLAACALPGCSSFGGNSEILNVALGEDAQLACKLTRAGTAHFRKGHFKKAEAAFKEAICADETYGPAHNNLGLLYFEQRDLYQAAWAFERATEFMPERGEPFNNLGLTYQAGGRWDEAIEMFHSAYLLDSTNPEFLGNLLRARVMRGELDESVCSGLRELLFIEKRAEWVDWAEDQLALASREERPQTDSKKGASVTTDGPELLPSPLIGPPLSGPPLSPPEVLPETELR